MPLIAIIGTLGAEAAAAAAAAPAIAAAAVPLAATAIPSAAAIGTGIASVAPEIAATVGAAVPEIAAAAVPEVAAGTGIAGATPLAPAADVGAAGSAAGMYPVPEAAPLANAAASPFPQAINPAGGGITYGSDAMAQAASSTPSGIMAAPGTEAMAAPSSGVADSLSKGFTKALDYVKANPYQSMMMASTASTMLNPYEAPEKKKYGPGRDMSGFQRSTPSTVALNPSYTSQGYAVGGPIETMAAQNAVGANTMYPQAGLQTPMYANPQMSRPMATNVIGSSSDVGVDPYTGEQRFASGGGIQQKQYDKMMGERTTEEQAEAAATSKAMVDKLGSGIATDTDVDTARKGPMEASVARLQKLGKRTGVKVTDMPKSSVADSEVFHAAQGGIAHGLGGYSDGGRLLRGPGDGMSDHIPAVIGKKQPARLADGEFVIPADVVSHLGNGSTEAGSRKLYEFMDKLRKARTGNKKQGKQINPNKFLPK